MLGPDGGMLFITCVHDQNGRNLGWGGPDIEAQSWESAEKKAGAWSHDRITGFILGYAACGKPLEPAIRLVESIERAGGTLRLRVDGVLYEIIPA